MREEEGRPGGGGGGRRGQRGEEYRTEEEATTVEPQTVVPVVAQPLLLAAPSSSPRVASSSSPSTTPAQQEGLLPKCQTLSAEDNAIIVHTSTSRGTRPKSKPRETDKLDAREPALHDLERHEPRPRRVDPQRGVAIGIFCTRTATASADSGSIASMITTYGDDDGSAVKREQVVQGEARDAAEQLRPRAARNDVNRRADLVDGIDTESMMEYVKVQVRVTDAPNLSFLTMTLGGDEEEKAVFPILHAMDRNLLVFDLSFPDKIDGVYLIYDTIGKTLSMIPALSSLSSPDGMAHTTQVLIARRHAAVDDGSYALALLGKMGVVDKPGEMPVISWPDVIYQWRPSSSISPWKLIKNANLPQQWMADKSAFSADMAFSFEGHAFWVDLIHGVLFCSCADLLSDDVKDVDFDSIDLPLDCLKFTPHSWTMAERQAYRTVGCTGNSIKLISMHFSGCVKRGAPKVTVWRLEVYAKIWVKEHVLNLKTLWTQPAFLAANLPMDMAAIYAPVVVPSDLTSYIPPTAAVAFPTVAPTVSTAAIATVVSPPNVPASPATRESGSVVEGGCTRC
uniref:DUF1618 domain-containing protein n=1 Tax=Oryza sativa subsp. japonica TaxID=39947 RepID=Q852M8_ORYSJ|nr:hypothetical protein [Oryza sativa Japonica Group]